MRFHILGLAHTVSMPEYSSCAFTSKVVKLCKMLSGLGHEVFHYGHQDSQVICTEHVTVVNRYDLDKSYKNHDWRQLGFPSFDVTKDWAWRVFNMRAAEEIKDRAQPGDFLLCSFGLGHKSIADQFPYLIVVEPGIGYPAGGFAPFRVFESYAILHAYRGLQSVERAGNDHWYDAVIPNCFDAEEFPVPDYAAKQDYLLFCGRVNAGKGIHIAEQMAAETERILIVAGAGEFEFTKGAEVERIGVVDPVKRRELMLGAHAMLCPSTFLEPFCGVQIEAMLCGAPVISSDWGAFAEYNIHGKTGFRCRTFEQFAVAVDNVKTLDRRECRSHGEKFLIEVVAPLYEEYFQSVSRVFDGSGGWYAMKAAA